MHAFVDTGHTDSVICVSFSSDGKYVATGGMDGQALVWDTATGAQVVTCDGCTEVEVCCVGMTA